MRKFISFSIVFFCFLSLVGCSGLGKKNQIGPNEKISTYFTMGEAIHSDYAKKHGINNYPKSSVHEKNIFYTAKRMDKVRKILKRPIKVTSWYRSPKVNRGIGGSNTSAHVHGLAVDFYLKKGEGKNEIKILKKKMKYDQLIFYPKGNRAHIGFRKDGKDERQEYRVK